MNKFEIINNYSKSEFSDFIEQDDTGKIFNLLDDEGLKILKSCTKSNERLGYIITYSKYKNELFLNPNFVELFLNSDLTYFYGSISALSLKTAIILFEAAINTNKDDNIIHKLFIYIKKDYQLEILKRFKLSKNIIVKILQSNNPEAINQIFKNYYIDLAELNINYEIFFELAEYSNLTALKRKNTHNESIESINIPSNLITKSLAQKIFKNNNIFKVRKIINSASHSVDPEVLNTYVKEQVDRIILSNNNTSLISPYHEIFKLFYELNNIINNNEISFEVKYNKQIEIRNQYINIIKNNNEINISLHKLEKIYKEDNLIGIYNYLQNQSNKDLSNYIIDYHFEENYHNIMIDITELLNLYYNGDIKINEERLHLYQQIQNIDLISYEEKIELHNTLKNYNIIEIFYDDMAYARKIVRQALKDYSLTQEELKKYKDEKLSQQYGVDVYVVGNEPFFGVVKSGIRTPDEFPTGHSFSLVGRGGITVFGENTFLYDSKDLNPDQIVHVYPFDSFTLYKPFESTSKVSQRVNVLMMPEELVEYTDHYTEILILEQGLRSTEIDKDIPKLKKIALYCIDKIEPQDIQTAQKNNVGIILVDSKKCKKSDNKQRGLYRHTFDSWEYNYYDGGDFEKEKFETKRK